MDYDCEKNEKINNYLQKYCILFAFKKTQVDNPVINAGTTSALYEIHEYTENFVRDENVTRVTNA